jgi:hypothetical protein
MSDDDESRRITYRNSIAVGYGLNGRGIVLRFRAGRRDLLLALGTPSLLYNGYQELAP